MSEAVEFPARDGYRLAGTLFRAPQPARGDRLRLCPDILNTEGELAQCAEELGALMGR